MFNVLRNAPEGPNYWDRRVESLNIELRIGMFDSAPYLGGNSLGFLI